MVGSTSFLFWCGVLYDVFIYQYLFIFIAISKRTPIFLAPMRILCLDRHSPLRFVEYLTAIVDFSRLFTCTSCKGWVMGIPGPIPYIAPPHCHYNPSSPSWLFGGTLRLSLLLTPRACGYTYNPPRCVSTLPFRQRFTCCGTTVPHRQDFKLAFARKYTRLCPGIQ